MIISFKTSRLIKADLEAWIANGATGVPQFSLGTITAVDSETNGRASRALVLTQSTTINWAQILQEILPILMQIIPMIISLFGGSTTQKTKP